MSLKRDEYWWIEDKSGKLIKEGRKRIGFARSIPELDGPNVHLSYGAISRLCRGGERPIKVKIVKVEK